MSDFQIKQNDTRPGLSVTLLEGTNPIDLTNVEEVNIILREKSKTDVDGPDLKALCDIDADPTSGKVSYSWKASDTETSGEFSCEFELTYTDGGIETVPRSGFISIAIEDDLG